MPFVDIAGLSKSFRAAGRDLMVLRDLELAVEANEMVAIVGASGVGKSTLLQVIGGLDRAQQGRIAVDGTDLATLDDDALVGFRHRAIGFVFQFHHLLPEFTAVENAEMPMRIGRRAPAEARDRAEALLAQVGLGDRSAHRPGMLSGGEQQRVALARALVMQPALLLADEPTGDLDETTAAQMQDLLRTMHAAHGLTSIIATHNMQLAGGCDRVLRLANGRLAAA
ncbi:MAG: ABC transporter ATP-binding protein [Acidobacteria bacterium]|nr:ABC transporter ATP-binding protein [Acidobacteriota bacterium]MXZ72513.1 ABC transporter ATP-binding protein [Acidobacteriota bacterium]MYD71895.1 ABC transporter ATP-binding protein [Acidobacteriota bacterium]MYJ03323.1 ABC transporter ATP-binding protein [Acidobacteriota bacterium]